MIFAEACAYPILYGCWLIITIVTSYIVAVYAGHVEPFLPVISDTGTLKPESCIFGTMMNIGAALSLVILVIRYRQIQDLQEENKTCSYLEKLNNFGLIVGIISVTGSLLVANFQVELIQSVHDTGSFSGFSSFWLYSAIQTFISFKVMPLVGRKSVNLFRLILVIFGLVLFSSTLIWDLAAGKQFRGESRLMWKLEDGGYGFHILGAIGEYLYYGGFVVLFVFTFIEEFRHITLKFTLTKA